MATMKDIARLAGVSQATVSRVINGHRSVHPEIREKVMEWVYRLDYKPNASARALANSQSKLIGLVVPDVSNPFFPEIIRAVSREVDHHGYGLLLADSGSNALAERRAIDVFRERRVEGLILVPVDVRAPHVQALRRLDIPVVIMTQLVEGFLCVSTDHVTGGRLVAYHLADLGHTRIACVGWSKDPKYRGFVEGLHERGLYFAPEDMFECQGWGHQLYHDAYERLGGRLAAGRPEFTAVFCLNDLLAFGAMHALRDFGLRVPEDVAVVGFDNTALAAYSKPGLTSVAQPREEIGRLAVEVLFKRLTGADKEFVGELVLRPRLVVRESTSKAAPAANSLASGRR
jgi:Transcriptional regulators